MSDFKAKFSKAVATYYRAGCLVPDQTMAFDGILARVRLDYPKASILIRPWGPDDLLITCDRSPDPSRPERGAVRVNISEFDNKVLGRAWQEVGEAAS